MAGFHERQVAAGPPPPTRNDPWLMMDVALAEQANQQLVDRFIAEGSLYARGVIDAFRATPRHLFLDRIFQFHRKQQRWREILTREPQPEQLPILYGDRALVTGLAGGSGPDAVPISSSSQPSLMGLMLQDLDLAPGQRVLEIGAGTGYNAALLAHIVGPGRVTSIDVDRDVLSRAWDSLRRFAPRQISIQHADGRLGWPAGAPYDRIIVTASSPDLEPAWLEQLRPGGKLLVPLIIGPGLEFTAVGTVNDGRFDGQLTRAAYFMPLRAERDAGSRPTAALLPPPENMNALAAPWANWFDRPKLRAGWAAFSQSLALFMLLRGAVLHHCTLEDGTYLYGVSRTSDGRGAWLGKEVWHASDEAIAKIVGALYRDFLEAGAPWPIDYELAIAECLSEPLSEETIVRHGPRHMQQWHIRAQRVRSNWL